MLGAVGWYAKSRLEAMSDDRFDGSIDLVILVGRPSSGPRLRSAEGERRRSDKNRGHL
jgi:hypothetical protein